MSKIYIEVDNIKSSTASAFDEASGFLKKANGVSLNIPRSFSHAKVLSSIKLDVIKQKTEIDLFKMWLKKIANNLENMEEEHGRKISQFDVTSQESRIKKI